MTTLYPGGLDSYSTKVDGVDDVMAADINNPQDAIEALEAQHQARSLRKIKNGSGATLAANKIGYFDVAGDFVTTATASLLASPWAAVISGGANNTQIVVGQGRVTIELTANCSIGDFLISSTTTGRAGVVAVWEAAVLAVALTANTSGAGGTCEAMLFPEIGFWVGFGVVVDEIRARNSGIDFGDGQMFLRKSDGFLGLGGVPSDFFHVLVDNAGAIRVATFENTNANVNSQVRLQLIKDNDAGSGFNKGVVLFHTTSGFGFANYEARTVRLLTGTVAGSATDRLVVHPNGDIGIDIGTSSPAAQMHIDQNDASGAQPVTLFDQADLSEEFINFVSTIGAGNPIDTAALGTYYGKIRIAVNGTFKYIAAYNP